MTEQQAKELLVVLATAWPEGLRWYDERQQDATRALYARFLLDLDYAAANVAVARLVATWKPTAAQRWPSIAELRSAITTVQHGRTPAGGEAWGAARKLTQGDEQAFAALDPVLRATLDALGWITWDTVSGRRRWRAVIGVNVEDVVADRARFIELYDQLAGRATSDRVVGELAPPIQVRRLTGGEPLRLGESEVLRRFLPAPDNKETKR